MHDITKSSNPDIKVLTTIVLALLARLDALEVQFAALPEAFVVPGPDGEVLAQPRLNAASLGVAPLGAS